MDRGLGAFFGRNSVKMLLLRRLFSAPRKASSR